MYKKLIFLILFCCVSMALHAQIDPSGEDINYEDGASYYLSPATEKHYQDVLYHLRLQAKMLQKEIAITINKIRQQPNQKLAKPLKRSLKKKRKQRAKIIEDISTLQILYIEKQSEKKINRALAKIEASKNTKNSEDQKKTVLPRLLQENENKSWHKQFAYFSQYDAYLGEDNVNPYENIYNCRVAYNDVDLTTYRKRIQMEFDPLFYYTHPQLSKHYKATSFLTGYGSIVRIGLQTYVAFRISIKSKDAVRNYGQIEMGSKTRIRLINGETIYIKAAMNANGKYHDHSESTVYNVLFELPKNKAKLLERYEIDEIGIMWTSGFESYEVYNLDLFRHQIKCIQKY